MEEARLRAAMVAAGARLGRRGLIAAAEGNLSVRLPGERLLVTPSGRRKDELAAEDLVVVPVERPTGGDGLDDARHRPTSDIAIHRAILASRPDVAAVAHAHLPASMALSLAGEHPDPLALPETAHFLPVLPLVAFGEMGSDELAGRVAAAFSAGDPRPGAVVLARHGAIAVGERDDSAELVRALDQAVDRLELVDVLCRAWRDALLVRAARSTTGEHGE